MAASFVDIQSCQMEICIDSLESAGNAAKGGATRLELCSALSEGGLTPTPGMLKSVRKHSIPIYAMVRVRAGNFVYTREEMDAMLFDLKTLKEFGVDGFVFGALTPNDEVDVNYCGALISAAKPFPVTFHRAFDEVANPFEALESLIELGFERILTSGQEDSAEEGLGLIQELVKRAGDRIRIMPGGGITKDNILKIKRESGAMEFHASARRKKLQGGTKIRMGAEKEPQSIAIADEELVRQMVAVVRNNAQ